jgi:hypothetical protein
VVWGIRVSPVIRTPDNSGHLRFPREQNDPGNCQADKHSADDGWPSSTAVTHPDPYPARSIGRIDAIDLHRHSTDPERVKKMGREARQPRPYETTLAERIGAVVSAGHPDAYCLRCLAGLLMEPEKPVRDAAQLAMVQGDLCVEQRRCCQCGRVADALTVKPLD